MRIQKRLAISRTLELASACVGSWTGSKRRRSNRGFLMAAVVFFLSCCSSSPSIAFQNTSHRQIYSLTLEDLEKLQFYISTNVVAQYQPHWRDEVPSFAEIDSRCRDCRRSELA